MQSVNGKRRDLQIIYRWKRFNIMTKWTLLKRAFYATAMIANMILIINQNIFSLIDHMRDLLLPVVEGCRNVWVSPVLNEGDRGFIIPCRFYRRTREGYRWLVLEGKWPGEKRNRRICVCPKMASSLPCLFVDSKSHEVVVLIVVYNVVVDFSANYRFVHSRLRLHRRQSSNFILQLAFVICIEMLCQSIFINVD